MTLQYLMDGLFTSWYIPIKRMMLWIPHPPDTHAPSGLTDPTPIVRLVRFYVSELEWRRNPLFGYWIPDCNLSTRPITATLSMSDNYSQLQPMLFARKCVEEIIAILFQPLSNVSYGIAKKYVHIVLSLFYRDYVVGHSRCIWLVVCKRFILPVSKRNNRRYQERCRMILDRYLQEWTPEHILVASTAYLKFRVLVDIVK